MRAHEFIPHDQLLESQLPPDQVRTRQRAWLWAELQNLLQSARKGAVESKPKPKTHKWAWKKPTKPKKTMPRRRKPRTGAIAPIKPKVLADPARAQRRIKALFGR
jgi:hypothetical protein